MALAQEPTSAKFDSMPRSAIDAGLADIVAQVEELPQKIMEYLRHAVVISKSEQPLEEKDQSSLEKILILLRSRTGQDFSMYKKNTVYRRVERRMGIHQLDRIAAYVRYLQENSQEVELLFKELLIGVTSFFRDPSAWEQVQTEAIPALLADCRNGRVLRAWSAGCSTGEEAYSLAIVFREALEQIKPTENFTVQIFATDLSRDAIDKARLGFYPAGIVADVSPERLQRFFIKEGNGYRVGKEIREMVTFATQNVIMDPPFTRLDILICRNLLIYLTPELQKKLLPLFHYSLNQGGVLFLGSSEAAGSYNDLFSPLNAKARLFRRRESLARTEPLTFPSSSVPAMPGVPKELPMLKTTSNLQALADQLLLQHFSPPAVLTNDKGDILYISGRTGKYLEPAAGKANWNIFAMAREEMQSSQEELKSTNEELQSTNEELQSTNEELTTSREEMQSMNEELQTVNAEQQSKMDELSRLNDDMRNLLNSTEIITIFLDNELKVRRFTTGADKLFKLISGDVGRPLSDIVNDLQYPAMTEEAREVLRTLIFSEKQVTTTDGRWFLVRIMPYRTMEDVISGVVITFSNITAAKVLEMELRGEIKKLKSL